MSSEGEHRVAGFGARVGERLRAAREEEGLSLADVAGRTRVPIRHLQMIEDGEYAGLPAATYSAGFVKAYARMIGLDAQDLSGEFRREIGQAVDRPHRPQPYEPADPRRTPPAGVALAALLIAIVVGLGFLYWRGSSDVPAEIAARGVAPAAAASGTTPSTAAPSPVAATGGSVVVGASEDVWLKVVDGGRTLFMGLMKAGDHYQLPADAVDPRLTTGRPGVTTVTVGATPIPPVGPPDQAAHDISLKAETLLARVAAPAPAVQPPPGAPTPVENVAGPG